MTCFGRLGFRNGLFFREFVLSLCQSKTWVPDSLGCRSRTQYSYFSIASPFSLLCSTFGQDDHLSLRRNALQWQAQPSLSCNRSSTHPEPFPDKHEILPTVQLDFLCWCIDGHLTSRCSLKKGARTTWMALGWHFVPGILFQSDLHQSITKVAGNK